MSGIGEVLETLRRANGLTQGDLCERAGVTQAAMSRYEHDDRVPNDEVLAVLADTLGVSVRFFRYSNTVRGALAVDAHMRRQKTTKTSVWRRLEARLNVLRIHTSMLFEEVSMHAEQRVPTFDPIDTTPADAALLVRAQWKMPIGPVRNLIRWLEAAGCVVFEEDFGTLRVDGLSQWIGDHPVILINKAIPTDKKRFTLTHELGHLVLHNENASEEAEIEAHQFAAEFLMPSHVIKPDLRNLNLGKLADLKRIWGTSMQALFERSYSLDLSSISDRTKFYKAMNVHGWKTREPGSEQLPTEHPQLVTAIGQTLRSRGLGDTDIAAKAGYALRVNDHPFANRQRLHIV